MVKNIFIIFVKNLKNIIMKKEDFNLDNYDVEESIKETLETFDEVFLVCFTDEFKHTEYYVAEVHEGDYYIGGDGFEYVNDSNIGFDDAQSVESYYKRTCIDTIVFSDENERDMFVEENLK